MSETEAPMNGSPEGKRPPGRPRVFPLWWEKGISIRAIVRELGLTNNAAGVKLVQDCGIEGFLSTDGLARRYPPDTIEKLRPFVTPQDTESAPAPIGAEMMTGSAGLLKTAHSHIEKIMGLVTEPMKRALDSLEKTNERLTSRCEKLEADRDIVAKERENLLSEEATRRMAEVQVAGEEARKEQAWALLMKSAPTLMNQLGNSILGSDPKVKAQMNAAIELLKTIEPDQLEALKAIDFLKPEQAKLVDVILSHRPDKPAKTASTTNQKSE